MVKPSSIKDTNEDAFNLRLSEGESNFSEMSRRSLTYSPTHGNSRDVSESDSALDSLDPSKRELLEARLFGFGKSPSTHNQDSQSNASFSSVNSDKEEGHENNTDRGHRRKRKADETSPYSHNKSGRAETGGKITEYFTKAESSPQQNNKVSSRPFQFNLDSGSTLPCPVMSTPTSSRHAIASEHSNPSLRQLRQMSNKSSHTVEPVCIHEACQTDVTLKDYEELEKKASSDQASSQLKDNTIEHMKEVIKDLNRQLGNLEESRTKLEKNLEKCQDMNKQLLIESSVRLKKKVREDCMNNRLRLGQFVPVRQGAHFVETWVDGFAFTELIKLQESITQRREELEKQKKYLMKRKPITGTAKEKKTNKNTSDTPDIMPLPPMEYYEQEEILKLRAMSLKKEELELQIELEKLEKQRNLHIRELKRIHSEDNSSFKDHPVLNERYLLLNLLGKGGFSEVYKGFDLKEQRYIACKIHQLNKDWKEDKKANYIKHALREYNIHRSLEHPRIVSLYDVFEIDANSFCTVLEYCDGNDLDFLLKQHKTIPEREARSIVMQVVRALKYLNEIKPPVIHYDLKPGNILLAGSSLSGEVKITDFGLSKIIDNDDDSLELTSQGAGTYWYLPPECFVVGREPPKISSKVDVWSVGVIFFQMLYGKKPFGHNLSQTAILEQNTILKAKEVEFPSKPQSSNEAKHFIRRCLAYRKDDRADVFALCEETYLRPSTSSKKSSSSTPNDANT